MTPENLAPADVTGIAQRVNDIVGKAHTAFACNAQREDTPQLWAEGSLIPSDDELNRLIVCDAVLQDVVEVEGADVARVWFIGASCCDMTQSPAEAIRAANFDEAHLSAKRMCSPEQMGW